MVVDDLKLIFVHIPRTGGTSVEAAIAGRDWWMIDADTKHVSASMTRTLVGTQKWQQYFKCSLVRNPWDRIISMYATGWWWRANSAFDKTHPPSLHEFIELLKPHPHEKYDSIFYHDILDEELDFIGRYEHLEQDFQRICSLCEISPRPLPHLEGRARGHYSLYYDDTAAELVFNRFRRDIELYGYSFERFVDWDATAIRKLNFQE